MISRVQLCSLLCSLLSDPLKGVTFEVCHYTKRDMRLGAKARFGVIRYERGFGCEHIGWFDDSLSLVRFLTSLLNMEVSR